MITSLILFLLSCQTPDVPRVYPKRIAQAHRLQNQTCGLGNICPTLFVYQDPFGIWYECTNAVYYPNPSCGKWINSTVEYEYTNIDWKREFPVFVTPGGQPISDLNVPEKMAGDSTDMSIIGGGDQCGE